MNPGAQFLAWLNAARTANTSERAAKAIRHLLESGSIMVWFPHVVGELQWTPQEIVQLFNMLSTARGFYDSGLKSFGDAQLGAVIEVAGLAGSTINPA